MSPTELDSELPAVMRAALLLGTGGPEMLVVRDNVAVPMPRRGDVLVRVAACGMNNTDVNTRVGWYSRSVTSATAGAGFAEAESEDSGWGRRGLSFPRIQGADIAGVVAAVGEGADRELLGVRVLVDPWLRDRHRPDDRELARYLGSERDGGFAEYCTVPSENVYPVSTTLSDVELASFACSWSTAEHMLQRVDLRRGESIAVPGASGGVGSALVQLAKMRGARVVAVAGASKLASVSDLGADAAVPRESDDVAAAALDANREPFDVVADIVGGHDFPRMAGGAQARRPLRDLRRHRRTAGRSRPAHPVSEGSSAAGGHCLRAAGVRGSRQLYRARRGPFRGRRYLPPR